MGNIAPRTMASNGKQFIVTCEMLTAVARDQNVELKALEFQPVSQIYFCFYFPLVVISLSISIIKLFIFWTLFGAIVVNFSNILTISLCT